MKEQNRYFFIVNLLAVALFLGVASAPAQVIFKRNLPVVSPQAQPPQPQADAWKPLPASAFTGTVTARVVWSKTFGLPPMYPGASETYPMPCGQFVVSVGNRRERIKASEGGVLTTEREQGGQYFCSYTIEGLPKEQQLYVSVSFVDTRLWEIEPWLSPAMADGKAAPPAGYTRVFDGGRIITLTDSEATSNVDFSIHYDRRPIKIF